MKPYETYIEEMFNVSHTYIFTFSLDFQKIELLQSNGMRNLVSILTKLFMDSFVSNTSKTDISKEETKLNLNLMQSQRYLRANQIGQLLMMKILKIITIMI